MVRIEKKALLTVALIVMAMAASVCAGTVTVATFADPSPGSSEELFTIDYTEGTIVGDWTKSGLTLEVPIAGLIYADATFELDPMTFTGGPGGEFYTDSGPSTLHFYDVGGLEVLTIGFDRLWIQSRNSGVNASDIYADGVVITGIGIPEALFRESFGFTFTNIVDEQGVVTATAAFDSSAVPEPVTMALLALGGLMIRRRK